MPPATQNKFTRFCESAWAVAMSQAILELVEKSSLKAEPPKFSIGDTVDVHTRILEGEKERIQIFNGVVIARNGSGTREMFTVRRIVQGEGVERKFPLHSPKIAKVEVKRSGVVRRAKLYFLRDRIGKAVKLRQKRSTDKVVAVPGEETAAAK
jgi:large subunit ribosomal protein L19